MPVADPTFLFDMPEYRACGAVFWPDCNRAGPDHGTWAIFGVPYRDEWEQESGQLLIDKRRSWRALCLCDWYNRHSDYFYRVVYGDKDTFRFAWHRAGCDFAMPPKIDWAGYWIRQADFQGRLLFQHRQGDKWSLQGNRRSPDFQDEEICLGFVRQLAERWNPLLHALRYLKQEDWDEMSRLAGHDYHYSIVGRRRWPLRLLADGKLDGAGPREQYWWCEAGRLTLSRLDRGGAVPTATYSPAAISMSGYAPPYNDGHDDLHVQRNTNAGLVTTSTYTSVTVGGDSYPNYLASQSVQEGTGGTPSLVQEYTYGGQAATGSTAALVYTATLTTYVDGTTATAVITTYGPTFYTGTAQVQSRVMTTLPSILSSQNGDGNTYTITQNIDAQNRMTQSYDPVVPVMLADRTCR